MLPLAEADLSTAHGVQITQVEQGRSQCLSSGYVLLCYRGPAGIVTGFEAH